MRENVRAGQIHVRAGQGKQRGANRTATRVYQREAVLRSTFGMHHNQAAVIRREILLQGV